MTTTVNATGQMEEVLMAPPLRIRYLPGRSHRLIVSLSGVGTQRHKEPPAEFFNLAGRNGENHVLFVSDESRSWLNAPGMAEQIVETITATVARIGASEVIAVGNSMGGTMAIHLAGMYPFKTVIAVAPQYSVDPAVVPDEPRWMYFRKRIADFRFRSIDAFPAPDTHFCILHGGTDDELRHARRFPTAEHVHHYVVPQYGHEIARALNDLHILGQIMTETILGHYRKVHRTVRAAGGMFLRRHLLGLARFQLSGGGA
jgi:pimeloyl-ACP methyl ester carboxylesterase